MILADWSIYISGTLDLAGISIFIGGLLGTLFSVLVSYQ